MQNHLDKDFFSEENLTLFLEERLKLLSFVTLKKISRKEYELLGGNILEETGENKHGKTYNLFVPEDLKIGEVLFLIDLLSKKFNLVKYDNLKELITEIKVGIGIILREIGDKNEGNKGEIDQENKGKDFLERLKGKYNISDGFARKLDDHKLDFGTARKIIRELKQSRENGKNGRIGKVGDSELISEILAKEFGLNFEMNFFDIGKNSIRNGLFIMTSGEISELRKREVKKGEDITIRVDEDKLEFEERKLKDAIGIDEFKIKLNIARQNGNKAEIEELELEASKKIANELLKYPYQATKENNGYNSVGILQTKEMYCVGFSLVAHSFLEELGISHNSQITLNHINLVINIGDEKYILDGANKISFYQYFWKLHGITDVKKGLLSTIYNNLGNHLTELGKFDEAMEILMKSIKIDPDNYHGYYNLGNLFFKLGKYDKAIDNYSESIRLNSAFSPAYNDLGYCLAKLGKYKSAITNFIRSIKEDYGNSDPYKNLSQIFNDFGKHEEAEIILKYYNKVSNKNRLSGKELDEVFKITDGILKEFEERSV